MKLVTVLAKNNSDFYKLFATKVHPNFCAFHEIRYVNTIKQVENITKEFTTETEQVPMIIIIGNWLYKDNFAINTETIKIYEKLKKRKKTIVIKFSTEFKHVNIDKITFPENPKYFEVFINIIKTYKIEEIVAKKNLKLFKKILGEVLDQANQESLVH